MRIAAALSTAPDAGAAAAEAAARAAKELGRRSVDLAFLFLTPQYLNEAEDAARVVQEKLAPECLLGCVAEGVLARRQELEAGPGAAVWAASLPGARIVPFHLAAPTQGDEVAVPGLPDLGAPAIVALLVDAFTFSAGDLLAQLHDDYPGVPLVGGIATGGGQPRAQALILDQSLHDEGAVGAALSNVAVEAVVSQGCAPIGRDAVITQAEANVIYELAGQPALARLQEDVAALTPEQQALLARGLLAGLVIDENKPEYGRGDFLIRGILGVDEASGALAVGERVRVGQTVRFHVRDAASADADLRAALGETLTRVGGRPAGALLFTCNGRGQRMFPEPDHDARAVSEALGRPAVAGFFCGGEIGPVGGRSFLHGFTATMAVFLDP